MNEVILALDFGLQTGWAVRRDNGTIVSGSICLGNGWKKDYGRYGHRFQRFRDLLNEQKAQNPEISEVVYEDPISHKGAAQARSYGGYLAHLAQWCEVEDIPYRPIHAKTLKKQFTGNGNATKAEMIHAIEQIGFTPIDDNEADALALLHMAIGPDGDG